MTDTNKSPEPLVCPKCKVEANDEGYCDGCGDDLAYPGKSEPLGDVGKWLRHSGIKPEDLPQPLTDESRRIFFVGLDRARADYGDSEEEDVRNFLEILEMFPRYEATIDARDKRIAELEALLASHKWGENNKRERIAELEGE